MFINPPCNVLCGTSKIYFLNYRKIFLFPLQFHHVIRGVHKVLCVFYGDDSVACVAESVNEAEQLLDILLMETAGGFVKEE